MSKVLVVEDSEAVAMFLTRFLSKKGYLTDTVKSGEEAIERIPKNQPDIILMDIGLAGAIDGIETAAIVRDRWSIPVIYVSALYNDDLVNRAAQTLPYAYLKKPVEGNQVIAEIELALKRRQAEVRISEEQKKTRSQLKQSEDKYRRLSEDMPVLVCTFLEDSTLTYVNKAYCDFFQKTEDELLGQKWINFLPEKARKKIQAQLHKLSPANPLNSYEHPVVLSDKFTGWQRWIDRAIFDEQGNFLHYQSIGEDITERKKTEEALRQSEVSLRIASDLARLGDWSVDMKHQKVTWSDQVALIHDMKPGYSPTLEEAFNFFAPEYLNMITQVFSSCAREGTFFDEEMQIITGNARRVWVRVIGIPERNDSGKIIRVQGGLQDITQRKDLEMQLVHSQKMEAMGELAAGIAHEINTPTQYVGDNTRFLHDAFTDLLSAFDKLESFAEKSADESLIKHIDIIKEESDYAYHKKEIPKSINQSLDGLSRITEIVKAMKRFSHPGTEDQITAFDLKISLDSAITISRNEWKYVSEVQTDIDPELPQIEGYPNDLNQVFLNLLINAAHAIKEKMELNGTKGLITVSAKLTGEDVEIQVKDTGTGIPEEHGNRVFNQFFTTKPVGSGTGQGLAIAYGVVVDKHQGRIWFESTYGQGTTFYVRLPVVQRKGD
ncbi:MAG: ATP-binding protein [Desulfonatronovibrio sp.]